MEQILKAGLNDQLEKKIRYRNHQLEAMEREMMLKQSLLDKRIRERSNHAKSLKEVFNETMNVQETRIMQRIAEKTCQIDKQKKDLPISHKQTKTKKTKEK